MAWTNISNANLDVGAPIRSIDILSLRDNITAQANGDSGAPKQQTAGIADAAITGAKLSGAQSGSAPVYGARAWVSFDGTTSPATIRASGNVSSVTRPGTGIYTVNFTTAMGSRNYSVFATNHQTTNTNENRAMGIYSTTSAGTNAFDSILTTSVTVLNMRHGSAENTPTGMISIFI